MGFTATLNLSVFGLGLIFRGSLFQSSGAETENAHEPYVAGRQMSGDFLLERSVAVDQIDKRVQVRSELCKSEGAL